ncbi:polygalacturonase-like [Gastrolobium bilobum]|uniref:polygalacturonase-like n=1 Tax=Gastrolobium bilobum TaxID=150636 RepID=UPI002AB0290E|nr:polygalacturonase-like [Gastrolobium bilobum]
MEMGRTLQSHGHYCWLLLLLYILLLLLRRLLLWLVVVHSMAEAVMYNVVDFGAKPDRETDSTMAFLNAWDKACASSNPALIYVPQGRFLVGNATFKGKCSNNAISISIDGTLVAPSNIWLISKARNWLVFEYVDGVSIRGGVLDAQGNTLWDCKNSDESNCPLGATTLEFANSNNIAISGLTSINSQMFHIVIYGCQNVTVQGVKVMAAGNSPNTDGIHVQMSSDVTILNSKIRTGDDCVSIGPGTSNLWIENIACGPGHGISIGSLGSALNEPGVQNVTVKTVTFRGTQNGVRIKTWGRPSNGFVRNVLFQDAVMVNVQNPIVIDQNYCPGNKDCPGQASGVKINNVTYHNVHGTSETQVAVKFNCSSDYPCSGIWLEDVKLTYNNQVAQALCNNAGGDASGSVQPESCL